jgi:cobalt-zinc-cadmium efflux system membrane fusion protein
MMKKILVIWGCLLVVINVTGQQETNEACNCPSCLAKASGEKLPFTLSGLKGLNEDLAGDEQQSPSNALMKESSSLEAQEHDEHEGPGHGAEEAGHEDHEGHDNGAGDLALSAEMAGKIGLQVQEAKSGTIARSVVFPAEIKLNRDRAAAVSPRYASIVRQVFAEIGDAVKKSDVLASLENRETLAVYTVAAPRDGVVVSKDISAGESAGEDRVLYEVADLSSVWADISIFPQYRHQVRKGQRVMLTASDGHSVETTVKYISPLVETETRTLQARCVLEGAGEDFTPGAFVRAEVTVQTAEVEVRVEKDAVQTVEGRPVIFIADEHGFESRDVELGLSDRTFVQIKSGLEHGEHYVSKGAFELKAEMITSGLDPHAGHGH